MTIRSLAPWYGSKRRLAPLIADELGPHAAYWEPFCGSMAVLLAKPQAPHETVNDLHGDLVNLARVIQDPRAGPALYRRLRRTLASEALWREARAAPDGTEDPVERAYRYFVASWLSRNGVSGTKSSDQPGFAVRWSAHGGHQGGRFTAAVDSLPGWRRRLRRVTILQRDAFEVLDRIEDAAGTAMYVDPPYTAKSHAYEHDFQRADHERLAAALARFRQARVVLSYGDDPRVVELYPGWTIRRIELAKSLSNSTARGANAARVTELLLINGASRAARRELKLFDDGAHE